MLEALVFFGAPFVAILILIGFALLEGEPRLVGNLFRHLFYPVSIGLASASCIVFLDGYNADVGWKRLVGILLFIPSFISLLFAEEIIDLRKGGSGPTAGA